MEQISTNDLIIGVGCTFGLAWVVWISSTVVNLLRANNSHNVNELKVAFKEMEDRIDKAIDKINERQDKFMQTEIQELKAIAKKE